MKDFAVDMLIQSLDKLDTLADKLRMIYMWIKQGTVNKRRFILLVTHITKGTTP